MPATHLIFSALRRKVLVQGHRLDVCIYRRGTTAWALMVISSTGHSKVWDAVFATEQAALDEYQRMVDGQHVASALGIDTSLEDSFDLNPALLKPIDQRLRDPLKLGTSTLRKFEIIKKYSGVWPIKNTAGHNITGYLYAGPAPVWPHPPQGAPGAPANIDTEFTVSGKHIDFYLSHDRRLQLMLDSWYQ
ncbi:MAG: hypothetical protein RLZZ296_2180 [Pseudomonadota bacterium]|jgi:hypothetical protein